MKQPELECEVCSREPAVGVAAIPGVPISVAYGRSCLDANAHPWWALVVNTALLGGLDQSTDWWQKMVADTCEHLGRPLEEFEADVEQSIREEECP